MKSKTQPRDDILTGIRLNIGHTDAVWTDDDLLGIYDNEKSIHGTIAACMEYLANNPELARKWEQDVKFTYYDYLEMAKYHRALAEAERSNIDLNIEVIKRPQDPPPQRCGMAACYQRGGG